MDSRASPCENLRRRSARIRVTSKFSPQFIAQITTLLISSGVSLIFTDILMDIYTSCNIAIQKFEKGCSWNLHQSLCVRISIMKWLSMRNLNWSSGSSCYQQKDKAYHYLSRSRIGSVHTVYFVLLGRTASESYRAEFFSARDTDWRCLSYMQFRLLMCCQCVGFPNTAFVYSLMHYLRHCSVDLRRYVFHRARLLYVGRFSRYLQSSGFWANNTPLMDDWKSKSGL